MSSPDGLERLRALAAERLSAAEAWRLEIVRLHGAGVPIRAIGAAAGVSHTRVLQIVRERRAQEE